MSFNRPHRNVVGSNDYSNQSVLVVGGPGDVSFSIHIQWESYDSNNKFVHHWVAFDCFFPGTQTISVGHDLISDISVQMIEAGRTLRTLTFDNNNAYYWNHHDYSKETGRMPIINWYGDLLHPHVNMWSGVNSPKGDSPTVAGTEIGYWY